MWVFQNFILDVHHHAHHHAHEAAHETAHDLVSSYLNVIFCSIVNLMLYHKSNIDVLYFFFIQINKNNF